MRAILDTSVLLGPTPQPMDGQIAISSASLAELHFGVLVARTDNVRADRLRRLALVERTFDALPIDTTVARHYGQLAASVAAIGRQPRARVMDLLIAATAMAFEASIVTRNPSDLVGLEGLVHIIAL